MGNTNRRDVSPNGKDGWKVTQPGTTKPTAKAPTQSAAERTAKSQVSKAGGGQVYIHTPKGKIRDADTVKPGNESKTRDTKH
jgi:sucrose-6-phosphate hydrolase SacC (GH32 family)